MAVLPSATFVQAVAKKPHRAVNAGHARLAGRLPDRPPHPYIYEDFSPEYFMSSRFYGLASIRLKDIALFLLILIVPAASARAADEPDLIFRRSTVFKWMSPNDKLATYGLDDPEVEGVACHFTVPEKGGFKGWLGLAEEVSDISLACRQIGPIRFKTKMEQGDDMFRQRRSLFFKKMQIVRGCDTKRNVLVYMVYSDKLIEGSPKNSTSTVPIMPWGPADASVQKCADFFTQ
jgi:CreA protein